MEQIDRRTFVGATAAAALAAAMPLAATASAEEAGKPVQAAQSENTAADVPLTEDPERLCERGGTTLTVEELNRIRRERVDAAGDFVKPDGTVVPAVWHKLDVLTNTYGLGGPDPEIGEALDYIMCLFDYNEQDAQDYLDMPWGKEFTVWEYAQKSGKTVEECTEICEDFSRRGLLFRAQRGAVTYYYQLAYIHGYFEQSIPREYDPDYISVVYPSYLVAPTHPGLTAAGTPIYYSIPCREEVVADERVLPLNDWREVVERFQDEVCLVPCCCGLRENVRLGVEVPPIGSEELKDFHNQFGGGHKLERCLVFGEEAEFYNMIGAGRMITKEEAVEVIENNIEAGLVIQLGYTNNSEIVCACHGDCCGVLGTYLMEGKERWEASPISKNASNYLLQYDADACLKCGACKERCPMGAIEMTGEDGRPEVTGICVRCGQCGLICPVDARTLTARDVNDMLPVPDNHMDDHNRKFGYRVQHGLA